VLYFERKFKRAGKDFIIGIDEAGRGPLAGPVVAAAVILTTHSFNNRVDDSKQLTFIQRERAFLEIIEKSLFGIGVVNEQVIDRVNIYQASRIAMEIAVERLMEKIADPAEHAMQAMVDGNMMLDIGVPCVAIIHGDARSQSIAAASILAKVTRDRIMLIYDKVLPQYGFSRHKGYGTDGHRKALKTFGRSFIHRQSFVCE
jgi:ribonuclease HII